MAKPYKRKIYIENDSRDSERCNDIRKSINATNRQEGKREISSQMEPEQLDDYFMYTDWDWKEHAPCSMLSTGGRFVSTLMRLGILEGGPHEDFIDIIRNNRHANIFWHPHEVLLKHLATNKDGVIYTAHIPAEDSDTAID